MTAIPRSGRSQKVLNRRLQVLQAIQASPGISSAQLQKKFNFAITADLGVLRRNDLIRPSQKDKPQPRIGKKAAFCYEITDAGIACIKEETQTLRACAATVKNL